MPLIRTCVRCAAGSLTLLLVQVAAGSNAVTHLETFDRGNVSNWQFLPLDATTFIAGTGGNPGRHLTHTQTQWPWPTVRTTFADSVFTGDYRALNVTSIGLDMIVTLTNAQPHPDFTVSVMFVYDNGTPGNTSDDTRLYFNSGQSIPWPGQGWMSYDIDVPSQLDPPFPQLPPGWQYWEDQFGTSFANHSWREVMENVTEVWFVGINDPAGIGFLLNWISGVDNMRLSWKEPAITGDLDNNGTVNVFDLLILLSEWGDCDDPNACPADLDENGIVNVFDLLTLLANWGSP